MTENRQIRLASRPLGTPSAENWSFAKGPVPVPGEGEMLLRTLYISVDPAMRGWISEQRSYIEPVAINEVMRAGGIAEVVESHNPKFQKGDFVSALTGVQDYSLSDGKGVVKVDPKIAPLPTFLGGLGMPGMTAYFGLLDLGQPKEGETVLVSGAAGAVGGLVGQIAKIKGLRAVGIAGGPDKCQYLLDLGYDAAVDYKAGNLYPDLKRACPNGVDIFFDNVGGDILDAALARINRGARILICGAISQYNNLEAVKGPKNYLALLSMRARMEGFVVFDYAPRYASAAVDLANWAAKGQLVFKEDIVEGLETFPETFNKLFKGENFGKLVIKV